jgi:hypothetical protein
MNIILFLLCLKKTAMKNYFLIIALSVFSLHGMAQTETRKWGMALGGGNQQYQGYLGNGFCSTKQATYGVMTVSASRFLNKSLDLGIFGTLGDYGYCQPGDMLNKEVDLADRCKGCTGRVGMGDLSSRMGTAGLLVKYKFANGYLLSAHAKIQPYVYAGAAWNNLIDIMKHECVTAGNYFSLNAGVGCKYYLTSRLNMGCNFGLGCIPGKSIDDAQMGKNDKYLQNTFFVGIDLF